MAGSGFANAMQAFESATNQHDRAVAKRYIMNLFSFQGSFRVRFESLRDLDAYTRGEHGFLLVCPPEQLIRDRPSSWQVFYQHNTIQVRVKTDGTKRRPAPHMVVTMAVGKSFPDEVGKFNRSGDLLPKLGPVPRIAGDDFRTIASIGPTVESVEGVDDTWANAVHFDLPQPFDADFVKALTKLAKRADARPATQV